jgi:c-di-GMP-binding flagellar brake protein YcgR
VDEAAQLLLMDRGSTMQCNVIDFSLGGCRLRTGEASIAGPRICVEVTFKIRGIDMRFRGITQWTDGRHLVGIRFVDLSSRRREDLAEVLSEVEAMNAAKAEKEAAEMRAA